MEMLSSEDHERIVEELIRLGGEGARNSVKVKIDIPIPQVISEMIFLHAKRTGDAPDECLTAFVVGLYMVGAKEFAESVPLVKKWRINNAFRQ